LPTLYYDVFTIYSQRILREIFYQLSDFSNTIIKKVAAIFKFDLSGVGRGALSAPKKVLLWTLQKSPRLQTGES
jgi:hypothetical protein